MKKIIVITSMILGAICISSNESYARVVVEGNFISHPRPHAWYCSYNPQAECYVCKNCPASALSQISPGVYVVDFGSGLPKDTIWVQCQGCE